jgi:peptide/nickel transport system permease protein
MGTDSAGRDVLSRLLYGMQVSLSAAAVAVLIAAGLGISTGLVAGYFGGTSDTVANWVTSMIMTLPDIVVLQAASIVLGKSVWTSMEIFGVLLAPGFDRPVYVTVRGARNELSVDAARLTGLTDRRIIGQHIL